MFIPYRELCSLELCFWGRKCSVNLSVPTFLQGPEIWKGIIIRFGMITYKWLFSPNSGLLSFYRTPVFHLAWKGKSCSLILKTWGFSSYTLPAYLGEVVGIWAAVESWVVGMLSYCRLPRNPSNSKELLVWGHLVDIIMCLFQEGVLDGIFSQPLHRWNNLFVSFLHAKETWLGVNGLTF